MILRRYGTSVKSVEANFESKALNEIGFRRDEAFSIPTEEFETAYTLVSTHELEQTADGDVQDFAEQELLKGLLAQLDELHAQLGEGEVLFVESESGDWPKTRQLQKNVIVEGENRLYFYIRVEPALRIGVYRRAS